MLSAQLLLLAAAKLNNTACSLLQSGCYRQGLDTLSAALRFIQELAKQDDLNPCDSITMVSSSNMPPQESSRMSRQEMNQIVQATDLRLANPKPDGTTADEFPPCEIASDDEWISTAFFNGIHTPTLRLIRMEPSRGSIIESIDNVSTDVAVVLYNLAIAYKCSALVSVEGRVQRNYNRIAFRLLSLGYATISADQEQCEEGLWQSHCHRNLLVTTILLQELVRNFHDVGMSDQFMEYCDQLQFLHEVAAREWGILGSMKAHPASAA